jgi:dTDP-4-amino-4,6-dideoxygalactose transaminase
MNDVEAALVLAQLKRLPEMIRARQDIAHRYIERLADPMFGDVFRLPAKTDQRVWYRFAVEMLTMPAETMIGGLQLLGIHAAKPLTDWRSAASPDTPVADWAYRQVVSLPLYPTLTQDEQDRVVDAFLKLCKEHGRA